MRPPTRSTAPRVSGACSPVLQPSDTFVSPLVAGAVDRDVYPLDGERPGDRDRAPRRRDPRGDALPPGRALPAPTVAGLAETQLEAVGFQVDAGAVCRHGRVLQRTSPGTRAKCDLAALRRVSGLPGSGRDPARPVRRRPGRRAQLLVLQRFACSTPASTPRRRRPTRACASPSTRTRPRPRVRCADRDDRPRRGATWSPTASAAGVSARCTLRLDRAQPALHRRSSQTAAPGGTVSTGDETLPRPRRSRRPSPCRAAAR